MATGEIFGWLGACVGVILGLPQLLRLMRTRNIDGLSLMSWRLIIAMNIAWTAHGIRLGEANMITTNSLQMACSVPIAVLLSRAERLRPVIVLGTSVGLAALMIGVDQMLGSAMFGVFSIVVAVVSGVGQSVQLVRAPHVNGVSTLFAVLAVVNQVMWVLWGLVVRDTGTVLTSSTMGVMTVFNLVWYVLRRLGLRAFFADEPATELSEREPATAQA